MSELTKRQKEIIDASLEIINTQGIQNLTMKTLAEKINVTDGAIYRHFKSKDDILAATAELFKSKSTEILDSLMSSSTASLDKIKEFFLGRCRQFSENRGLALVMFSDEIFAGRQDLRTKVHETINTHRELLLGAIKEGQEKKILREIDPPHMFMMIMGALRLLVTRWKSSRFGFDLVVEGEQLWESIVLMISQ